MSDEFFYRKDGKKEDAKLHARPPADAEKAADLLAVKQAVARGMTRKRARELFLKK